MKEPPSSVDWRCKFYVPSPNHMTLANRCGFKGTENSWRNRSNIDLFELRDFIITFVIILVQSDTKSPKIQQVVIRTHVSFFIPTRWFLGDTPCLLTFSDWTDARWCIKTRVGENPKSVNPSTSLPIPSPHLNRHADHMLLFMRTRHKSSNEAFCCRMIGFLGNCQLAYGVWVIKSKFLGEQSRRASTLLRCGWIGACKWRHFF